MRVIRVSKFENINFVDFNVHIIYLIYSTSFNVEFVSMFLRVEMVVF